jgi:Xaa-Pro aminopeptidase
MVRQAPGVVNARQPWEAGPVRIDETELMRFSDGEIARRRSALNALAEDAGVDSVLLYGANRSAGAVTWLTQWPVTREAAVLVTPGRPDLLLVSFYNHVPAATRLARGAEVRYGGTSAVATALAVLAERGAAAPSVGVIGPIPWQAYRRLEDAAARVVDLTPAYTRLRMVKSEEEIAALRAAARLTDASAQAFQDALEPGVTEHELVDAVERAYVPLGGSNHIHYVSVTSMADPDRCVPSQWPTSRRVEVGDVVTFELSTSLVPDYPGQLLRTFTVGADPAPLYGRLHAVAEEAFEAITSRLRPGVTAAELVDASSVIEDNGFTTVDDLVHGFGGGYLPPVLGTRSRTLEPVPELVLECGMTVVVQPNVSTPDLRSGVQVGELLLVTERGAERLHGFPRRLLRVG